MGTGKIRLKPDSKKPSSASISEILARLQDQLANSDAPTFPAISTPPPRAIGDLFPDIRITGRHAIIESTFSMPHPFPLQSFSTRNFRGPFDALNLREEKNEADNSTTPVNNQKFYRLHDLPNTPTLQSFIEDFNTPREHNTNTFIQGIQRFEEIANLHPSKRKDFFGDASCGLHYNKDLAEQHGIESDSLNLLCPPEWKYILHDGGIRSLIYCGSSPSHGLDRLLHGPTVIDCGMFCQIATWFGIRYMLGNKSFDAAFGKTPLHITQFLYHPVLDAKNAWMGNPLSPFLESSEMNEEKMDITSRVRFEYIANPSIYSVKHPGGNYRGDNCIVIDDHYTVFDPTRNDTAMLPREAVESLLLEGFNASPDRHDKRRLKSMASNPDHTHPDTGLSNRESICMAKVFSGLTLTMDEWRSREKEHHVIGFDMEKFSNWLAVQNTEKSEIAYEFIPSEQLNFSDAVIEKIPLENRLRMNFSSFEINLPQQQKIFSTGISFCHDVMNEQPTCIILTGNAGIGKTAMATCCAKELSSQGKKILWLSETMMNTWTDQAKDMAALAACRDEVRALLDENPDAVFMDDNNLVGYSGQVLFEEIYTWYATNPGKGLFITSNEPVTFRAEIDFFDQKYHVPAFINYDSPAYANMTVRQNLDGNSLRKKHSADLKMLSDSEKLIALSEMKTEQSVAIFTSQSVFESAKGKMKDLEFVPAFDDDVLGPIRRSLKATGTPGPVYDALPLERKKCLHTFQAGGMYFILNDRPKREEPHLGIAADHFEKTRHEYIAVEIAGDLREWNASISQLLRIINYAHDVGGKKIIIINCTSLSHEELLNGIKNCIPAREKKRTLDRLAIQLLDSSLPSPSENAMEISSGHSSPRLFVMPRRLSSNNPDRAASIEFAPPSP